MYEAYECSQLLRLTVQCESIAAYDDNLLVGTKQGHLLMYRIAYTESEGKPEVQLLRYNKNFSKKPIQQLAVVPEQDLLISLSDNVICVHDMGKIHFPTISTLSNSRGATLFTLDVQRLESLTGKATVALKMCVAVKRRLQFYYWKKDQFNKYIEDIIMPDTPLALSWLKDTICVGFKGDCVYSLYHLNKRNNQNEIEKSSLFPPGNRPPSVLNLNDEAFILGKDSHSIFINTEGQAYDLSQKHFKWEKIPRDLVYDEPYLVALLPEGLEVRTVQPALLVQALTFEDPRLIIRCRSGLLYVASLTHVWRLQNIAWSRQIHLLLEQKQFQLAIKIVNISDETSEDKAKTINQIQTLYAFDLFNKKQFKESMDQFLSLDTNPYDVIQLFPDLLPHQMMKKSHMDGVVKLNEEDRESALLALIDYLVKVRINKKFEKQEKDKKQKEKQERENTKMDMGMHKNERLETSKQKAAVGDTDPNFNYDQYVKATEQLLQIIDTTLLKCYLETNDSFVAPLLRLNHCNLLEAEKLLKKFEKYSELIILYETKGLHKKALDLLQKQATQHDKNDASVCGCARLIVYLQHLGKEHIDLIFQYGDTVLKEHAEEGLAIFTEDIQGDDALPRPKVLDFLIRSHENLVIPYLEHVIHVWRETTALFHDALVHQYKDQACKLRNYEERSKEADILRAKLLHFLEDSEYYSPENALVKFPYDSMYEERAIVLGKLGRHEQVLSIYMMIFGNVERAVEYCAKVYDKDKEGAEEAYALLLKMLISPPESWLVGVQVSPERAKPDLDRALSLLETHAEKMQPLLALEALPDTVPVARIKHFLTASLQKQLSERRHLQVLRGLVYAEHLQVEKIRMNHESQSIKMTELNICSVCKKRFGDQSAFARFPDGDIVHFSCQDRKN